MPWVFCCSDENLIDKTTLCSHPFSINTYLGLFLPLASLNSTIYHDAVISNPFHSFVLPHPSLFCKTPLLADVFSPKAMQMSMVSDALFGHVHVPAPRWVGPTPHLWLENCPLLLWCGHGWVDTIPQGIGVGELVLPLTQGWRQWHGCRRAGSPLCQLPR